LEWLSVNSSTVSPLDTWGVLGAGKLIPAGNWLISVSGFINGTTGITKGSIGWGVGSSPDNDKVGPLVKIVPQGIVSGSAPTRKLTLAVATYVKVWMSRGDSGYADYCFYDLTATRVG
jgi:hypothetical protein